MPGRFGTFGRAGRGPGCRESKDAHRPGNHCAEVLFSVRLPFEAVVRVLMDELGFTVDEATEAATVAQRRMPVLAHAARRG